MRRVDPEVAEEALEEFHDMTVKGRSQPRGGRDFAAGLLEASFGAEKAAGVMSRLASSMAGKPFEFLDDADPAQMITLLGRRDSADHRPGAGAPAPGAGLRGDRRAGRVGCAPRWRRASPRWAPPRRRR